MNRRLLDFQRSLKSWPLKTTYLSIKNSLSELPKNINCKIFVSN